MGSRLVRLTTPAAASVLGLLLLPAGAGCGSSTPDAAHRCSGAVAVATELPTTGSDSSEGVPAQNAVELAVSQADTNHFLGDCTVDLIIKDDASALPVHDPAQGARNMTALAANQRVVGVVGPFDSSVCAAAMPIANNAGLAELSPSCTSAALTQPPVGGSTPASPGALQPTGTETFFRLSATDMAEASTTAQEARKRGATRVYIVEDQESRGLAGAFAQDFAQAGGSVAGSVLSSGVADSKAALTDAAWKGANLIMYAGTSSQLAAQVRAGMHAAGLDSVLFVAADTVVDADFIVAAGAAAEGAFGVTGSPDPASLPSAAAFNQAYRSTYNAAPSSYSVNAYDAMNILLTAIKEAVDANGGRLPSNAQAFRASVRSFVASISFGGASGTIAFDHNGNATSTVVTLWQLKNGGWDSVKSVRS